MMAELYKDGITKTFADVDAAIDAGWVVDDLTVAILTAAHSIALDAAQGEDVTDALIAFADDLGITLAVPEA